MSGEESHEKAQDASKTYPQSSEKVTGTKKKIQDRNEFENVKSTAVVKYSVLKRGEFTQLQCNTDLNLPPSNWLSSSADSYGLQQILQQPKGFASFRMANMFPDCVGEVDVVSDSENIKKLLKIPYQKGPISMMVHRVENTLLLDSFDIYRHLLRTAENDWEWLRKFFYENIASNAGDEDRIRYIKNKKHKALKQKSLESKFLYRSLVPTENEEVSSETKYTNGDSVRGPMLPEPSPSEVVPDPSSFSQPYKRNVLWTFENIDMLIGTDMPIFGGGTHPCISLRLNDMNKPINVLTGIDYWLDNLMSNVPEVVMCFHLNGIVQKYELIKTEDLPRMDNSKFSPKLIRDVAQNILSFLKSNATKAGHTYWLFKGKDEEVIKLYDLTSLCSHETFDNDQNPFTVPVAMLLYRVARNMKHSKEKKQPGTIRMLLKNCIHLLAEEKYPEIVTSSHFMLSDLYIPATTDPDNPNPVFDKDDLDNDLYDDDIKDEENDKPSATKVLILNNENAESNKFNNYYKVPPPISDIVEDRCVQSVLHVAAGLNCIKYFHKQEFNPKKEENVPFAKPNEAIPMPYSKLNGSESKKKSKKSKKRIQAKDQSLLPKTQENNIPTENIFWKDHLKTLLYEKAVLVYAITAERHYQERKYGATLRCIGILVRCLHILQEQKYVPSSLKLNWILGRAGDSCIMIKKENWEHVDEYNDQLRTMTEEDTKILEQIEKDEQIYNIHLVDSPMKCVFIYEIRTEEQMLLNSVDCYEAALKIQQESPSTMRRLGNARNETGTFYIHKAKTVDDVVSALEICKMGEKHLKRALELFDTVNDDGNMALVYSNLGHLHRTLAHMSGPITRAALTKNERFHYNKSFEYYRKALQVLGDRKQLESVWDTVLWELSTALFTMATIMHEYPSPDLTRSELEKEIIEMFQKALQYCDLNKDNARYFLYQYRAAVIYNEIAALYHSNIFNSISSETNRRNLIQLIKINYEKSAKLFLASNDGEKFLTCQMKWIALIEYLAETSTTLRLKLKHFKNALTVLCGVRQLLKMIIDKKIEVSEEDVTYFVERRKESYEDNICSLLRLVKERLQSILKLTIKLCLTQPPITKHCDKLAGVYKSLYVSTFKLEGCDHFHDFVCKLNDIFENIESAVDENNVI